MKCAASIGWCTTFRASRRRPSSGSKWHHLLSLVDNPALLDPRNQILADGLFHVLMYIVTVLGLGYLWKSRQEFSRASAGRWLLGTALLGFGLWNVLDVGFFHWIMRIHRIRIDSPDPMFWDLAWLALFGLIFLAAGGLVRSRANSDDAGPKADRSISVVSLITLTMVAAGIWAALPPSGSSTTMVLFKPGIDRHQISNAFDAADVRVVWADRSGGVWAVKTSEASNTLQLYRHGAMLVSNSNVGLGCISWSRI
jgi:uncharacterized membrane protein